MTRFSTTLRALTTVLYRLKEGTGTVMGGKVFFVCPHKIWDVCQNVMGRPYVQYVKKENVPSLMERRLFNSGNDTLSVGMIYVK